MHGFGLLLLCGGLVSAGSPAAVAYVAGRPANVPAAARAVGTSHPNHVVGNGTPASCTAEAVVRDVAEGGIITFNCGPRPVTITMTAPAKVVNTSHQIVLDGGGKVTLNGAGTTRILYMNTCDPKQVYTTDDCWQQQWPQLVVQNITFENAYSGVPETSTSNYGGTLEIEYSTLHHNPSGEFQNAPGIFDHVDGRNTQPVVVHSSIS
jgi:hypothetical protein